MQPMMEYRNILIHKDKCTGVSISETELIATILDILKRELAAVLGDYALLLKDNTKKKLLPVRKSTGQSCSLTKAVSFCRLFMKI